MGGERSKAAGGARVCNAGGTVLTILDFGVVWPRRPALLFGESRCLVFLLFHVVLQSCKNADEPQE